MKGIIKRWFNGRGYGFIEPEEGEDDVFLHFSEVDDPYQLTEGKEVEFEVKETYRGLRAINVKIIM
ncbi:MAG: cold-shock protein [Candidatus Bathyarchaeia archaeon]